MKAAATKTEARLIGRVERVIQQGVSGYGFIITDDRKQYFFHKNDCAGRRLPSRYSIVSFDPVPQTATDANDRAAHVQIVSSPE